MLEYYPRLYLLKLAQFHLQRPNLHCDGDNISAAGAVGTATALTFRPFATFGADEDGLGENASPPPQTACSDTDCEINGTNAVVIHDTALMDAIVGSAQTGEGWKIWAGPSATSLTLVAQGTGQTATMGTCSAVGAARDMCTFTPEAFVAVQHGPDAPGVTGNVLFNAISFTPVTTTPEPASLALLGTALAGLGLMRRRRRS